MERAALFKEKNYDKLMSDVFIVTVSNHKRIRGHLVQVFFKTIVKRPDKRLKSVSTQSAELQHFMKINLFMAFALR